MSEVSRLLGLSRKTVRGLARAGRLPVVDLGLTRILIDRKRLEALLAS